jgi:hypothetical protein
LMNYNRPGDDEHIRSYSAVVVFTVL